MGKQFFEVHGLLTLDPGTKREREVWHPVICVTSEMDRNRMFRSLFSEKGEEYAKRNGTGMYEDFKKVDPPPMSTPTERPRRRKAEYIVAPETHLDDADAHAHYVESMPGEQGVATTGEVGAPRRRRRRQKAPATPEPKARGQRASSGRSGADTPPKEPRSRSRRRRKGGSDD